MYHFEFWTKRLYIREYNKRDIEDFIRVAEQPEVYATTYGIPREYPKSMAKSWFKFIRSNLKTMQSYEFAMTLRESGRYIGNVGLINVSNEHKHADISYYIDRDFRCLGLVTEAAREMLRFGFEELDFEKISGLYMSNNPASGRVMEKIGMKPEGMMRSELLKDGVFYDLKRFSILRREYFTDCKS